jgi:unsaturated chondroitin disaccharide hydrolase
MRRLALATLATLLLSCSSAHAGPPASVVASDLEFARGQLGATAQSLAPPAYPSLTKPDGSWETRGANWWTSGFLAGSLWFAYGDTGDPSWREQAERWQAGLESQKNNTSTHDLGFMILNSFGSAYELTGVEAYRQVVLDAAASLATRFSPVVGCTRSWNSSSSDDFIVIVDNMMNLELLFWGARNGGDPAWRGMAISHALKTMENHVRPDGSTYHVVDYDPGTGAVRRKRTVQGLSTESTWSRGQAWALHGFAIAYRETGDARFLDTARRTADYFVAGLPADRVPYWDFLAPSGDPRDSSAAAIAASGLLELSRLEPDRTRAAGYFEAAGAILDSLSSSAYLATDGSSQAILLHGTSHKPAGSFDTGLVFGDYYFVEALLRYRALVTSGGPGGGPGPGADLPVLALKVPRGKRTIAALLGRGLPVRVNVPGPGRLGASVMLGRGPAKRLGLTARAVRIARGSRRVTRAGWTTVRAKAPRRMRHRLRQARRLRVRLAVRFVTDSGEGLTRSKRLTLRRR